MVSSPITVVIHEVDCGQCIRFGYVSCRYEHLASRVYCDAIQAPEIQVDLGVAVNAICKHGRQKYLDAFDGGKGTCLGLGRKHNAIARIVAVA